MIASVFLSLCVACTDLPQLTVTRDHTEVRVSCRIVIPEGVSIADPDGGGVLQIAADDIEVQFDENSFLNGSADLTALDRLSGTAIRINGHRNVRITGAHIRGYKLGIWATAADGLEISKVDCASMFARRLLSTPETEDASDWFYPHHNDETPWRDQYGGAIVVERSEGVAIHDVRVRHGQHGIILDRVGNSKVFDNDCSFLSGWGLALWRSSDNMISRNAFDFCIRGYSHGIYNRGQDSAGILIFEQCNRNTIVENSVTHGGDGIFGFAGREAIGELTRPGLDHSGLGCNDNVFIANDLSFAAAHGLEMTFSHRNVIARNRMAGNAICGIWGGYAQDTQILENDFSENGGAGYGLERGAINIEHGSGNLMLRNRFVKNACAVHLWWDDDGKLLQLPGVKASDRGVSENTVAQNTSIDDEIFLRVRDAGTESHIHNLRLGQNTVTRSAHPDELPKGLVIASPSGQPVETPDARGIGNTHPVGARRDLAGRENIIMTDFGPWDHADPLVRVRQVGASLLAEVLPASGTVDPMKPNFRTEGDVVAKPARSGAGFIVEPREAGVLTPCKVTLSAGESTTTRDAILLNAAWEVTFFPWSKDTDPRTHLDDWLNLAGSSDAVKLSAPALQFKFGANGPRDLKLSDELTRRGPGRDHFGLVARSRIRIPAGKWQIVTTSDDGVRVKADGKTVLENWTWHGPTRDQASLTMEKESVVEFEVQYFEIDGHAVLDLQFELTR